MEKKPTSPGAKALIIGLLMIAVSFGLYFAEIRYDSGLQYLTSLILIAGIIISINVYGKEKAYTPTFGNYFAHGFKVSAIVALIMIGYLIVFLLAFPDFKENAIKQIQDNMKADKNVTPDQVEQAMSVTRKGFVLFAVGGNLIFTLLAGTIGALIGAAITKKNQVNYSKDVNQIGL